MTVFRCPVCGDEAEIVPEHGTEVASVHCLKHTGGADGHVHPVHMSAVPSTALPAGVSPGRISELAGSARS